MSLRCISFDASGTLLRNRYQPGAFAEACLEGIGAPVPQNAAREYEMLLHSELAEFWKANQTRSFDVLDKFWIALAERWLKTLTLDPSLATALHIEGRRQLEQTDRWFQLYPDTLPALKSLREDRLHLAVLSNWDLSLLRILQAKGILDEFEVAIPSLAEGVEKPDPALFQILLNRLELRPEQVLHVGDDLTDDVQGAFRSGLHVAYLNRAPIEPQWEWSTNPPLGWNDPEYRRLHMVVPTLTALAKSLREI